MQKKTDRRVRKTKSQLRKGLAHLMKEKSIGEITVKELVDEVDINRSTFYLHYSDIPTLLREIEDEMMDEMKRAIHDHPIDRENDSAFSFIKDIFQVLDRNREIGCALIGPYGDIGFFHVIGLEFLHLHAADIGDNKVLDGGEVGFVGFGGPLVLAALLGQPIHEELCRRHRGRDQESASRQFMFDLLLSVWCLLFGGKSFQFVAALAVFIFVGVADAVRVAALRNICHTVCLLLSSCPVEPRIEAVLRHTDASAYPQDTEFGGAVAQVVSRAQTDGQHSCDLFHRVHQLCSCRAVSRRLDGIGLSDHFHCIVIRNGLQDVFRL